MRFFPRRPDQPVDPEPADTSGGIAIRHASKAYGANVVVDDVTLDLPAGGVTAVVGANGAGKSTLLSMIARLLPMDAGTIRVQGLDVTSTPGDALARTLAVLRQDNHVTLRLTVGDLVAFGRFPHSHGRLGPDDQEAIERALTYLDLQDLRGRYLDELSGGQRQRAYVAMVLAQDTPYVLLDEPLNNLDMRHSVEMMRILRGAADDLGRTVVVVLHDLNFAACWSDRIVAMRDGAVVHQGTPPETMRSDVLRAIFDLDIQVQQVGDHLVGLFQLPQTSVVGTST